MSSPQYAACAQVDTDPEYLKIAKQFVGYFYSVQDAFDRREEVQANAEVQAINGAALVAYRNAYRDDAAKTFEGTEVFGKQGICEHLEKKLTFKTIKYAVTTVDAQPGPPPNIIIMVTGQLQTDEDRPLPFSHTFLLRCEVVPGQDGQTSRAFTIQNELFRLGVHNFAQ